MQSQNLVISLIRLEASQKQGPLPIVIPVSPSSLYELELRSLVNENGTLGHPTLSLRQQGIKASRNPSFQGSRLLGDSSPTRFLYRQLSVTLLMPITGCVNYLPWSDKDSIKEGDLKSKLSLQKIQT